jgi:plasmid replication initiation protein
MKKTKEVKQTKQKNITLIKKSNDLIEARYMFDIWETRFFLSILSQIHMDDVDFKTYRICYKDVVKTFGLKSNSSYENLRQAAKKIMNRKVAISYENSGVLRETLYHLIRKVDYMKESEDGKHTENQEYVDVSVEPEMKPLLLQLQKNFTAYDLRNVVRLGVYPIRIYELLKQYQSIGHRMLTIEQLKKMFELTEEYPRYSNFYQKIIQPAINDINKHTDLCINDVQKIKEGKNIIGLRFVFRGKNQEDSQNEPDLTAPKETTGNLFQTFEVNSVGEGKPIESAMEDDSAQEEEKNRLFSLYQQRINTDYMVTPTVFLRALEDKTEEEVERAIRMTEQARKNGEVKNLAGFFIDALRKKYTNDKEDKARKAQILKDKIALIEEELEKYYAEQSQLINDKIRALREAQPSLTQETIDEIEQNPFLKIFLEGKKAKLGKELTIEDYRQDVELRKLVKQGFIERFKEDFLLMTQSVDEKIQALENTLKKFQK